MSHTTSITHIVISDLDALKAAIAEINKGGVKVTMEKGGTPRAFYTNQQGLGPADYVLRLTGSRYDVGLYKDETLKGYVARTDLWGGDVAKVLGATAKDGESQEQAALGRLYQGYAVHAATRRAVKQGYTVQRINSPDGSVRLVVGGIQ